MNKLLAGRKNSVLTETVLAEPNLGGGGRLFSVMSWKMREREEKSLDYKLETAKLQEILDNNTLDEKSLQYIDCTSSCCHICHLSNKIFQYVSVLSSFLCSEPVNRGVLIREARFPVSDCLSFEWPHSRSSVSFITPLTVCLLSLPRHCLFLLSVSLPC